MCAEKCEDFNEKLMNGKCVKQIALKGASNNQDCITAYNQGSIWDGNTGCKCSQGYAGAANSFCTDCRRLGQVASGNNCTNCLGNTVLQNYACSECTNMIPSVDKLSCVTCSSRYGDGSIYSSSGTCVCDTANGFAGATNSVCTDCWRKGQAISGTSCAVCSGTTVLQSGVCSECSTNFVPSLDKQSCISCSQRFGQGSIYSAVGTCICDSSSGFAGTSNSVCSYCWVLGKTISGSSCAACSGTTVLQSGTCQECPNDLVPSADKLSCVSCASRYGEASTFVSFGLCRCTAFGFAGSDNSVCSDCLRMGQMISGASCQSCSGTQVLQAGVCAECPTNFVPSADKLSCISCSQRYGDGSSYSAVDTCICDTTTGFTALTQNSICTDCWRQGKTVSGNSCASCALPLVLQQGACAQCSNDLVPSADGLSCVTCSSRYGSGSAFLSFGNCRCSASGFAGNDNTVCVDCLRVGKFVSGAAGSTSCAFCSGTQVLQAGACAECPTDFVPSADKLSCVSCMSLYGPGSSYSTINTCVCRVSEGFGGANNHVCEDCKRSGQEASVTGCTACIGAQVLQSGTCQNCPAGSVQSLDKLSCVAQSTCQVNYGPGSYEFAPGTCRCQSSSGFAGNDNTICVDCLRIGQFVSGAAGSTTCAPCPGTQVLQSGTCQECPANFVPSSDKLSCISCSQRYGDGSTYSAVGTCVCDSSNGFTALTQNSICTDCWRQGKTVSGTTCVSCAPPLVLQQGACAQCSNDLVPSADGLSCVTCSSRYGSGSAFLSFGNCRCSASGFAGNDNTVCVDCLRVGKFVSGADGSTSCAFCSGTQVLQAGACAECPTDFVPSADKLSCVSCMSLYGPGSSYSTINTCVCRVSEGFGGANNHVCEDCKRSGQEASVTGCTACIGAQVLQSGTCQNCPAGSVQSLDKLSCVAQSTCQVNYGPGSYEFAPGTCRCQSSSGFAGNDNTICVDCLRIGQFVSGAAGSTTCAPCPGTQVLQSGTCQECPANFVPSSDKLSCISCSQRYGDGSTYSAVGTCVCDSSNGFTALTQNSICTDCWRQGKTVSGTTCVSCAPPLVLQQGACAQCSNDLVPSADGLSCVTCSSRYGSGSAFLSFGNCRCSASGFAGNDNTVCVDCLRVGKFVSGADGSTSCAFCSGTQVLQAGACAECPTDFVPSADKLSCVSCMSLYGPGSSYSTINTCVCRVSEGFGGANNHVCEDCKRSGQEASVTGCTACIGAQVLQSGTCQNCPAGSVQSLDKLSCVAQSTCQVNYGPGSYEFAPGTCRCQSSSGFAGNDNTICVDCLRIGQFVSGAAGSTTCAPCPGTQVLQSGTCQECPANFVPSSDKLSCISCSQRYGDGSTYSAVGTCVCDSSNGFTALTQNSICTDCWRQGKTVSGTTCVSCASPLVLQQGACAQCSNDLVPSADGLSCVTCSSRYGSGSAFLSFGNCRCSASGFAGNDNTVCVDCLRVGKFVSGADGSTTCAFCSGTQVLQAGACAECPTDFVPSADKLSCVSCMSLYGPGSSYSTINTCVCRVSEGFGGANNHVCEDCKRSGQEASVTGCTACIGAQVLQSGTCQNCPAGSVQSLDKLSCVAQSTCQVNYGPGSYEFAPGTCRCQSSSGFAGNDNTICVDCLRIGQFVSGAAGSTTCAPCPGTQVLQSGTCQECPANFVPSSDKLSCISCSQRYGDGSTYSAVGTCVCDSSNGFTALTQNSICTDCWRQGKTVSGTTCVSCASPLVLQQGACAQCSNDLVPSADGLSCVTCSSRYGSGSAFLSFGNCRCSASGFAGNDNTVCVDCLRVGKFVSGAAGSTSCAFCSGTQVLQAGACAECPTDFVPSADKLSCVSCMSLYGPGSSYSTINTCVCRVSEGFGGANNHVCEDCKRSGQEASVTGCTACIGAQVLQSGTCQNCPAGSVQSLDKLSCVAQSTCQVNYGPGSYEFAPGTCRCQSSSGFAGNDNTICVDCLRIGQFVSGAAGSTTCAPCPGTQVLQSGTCQECPANFVPSSDKLSCISCSQRYGDGSTYSAVGTCVCDSSNGFTALTQNSICTDCWRQGKTVSGTTCVSCASPLVLQQGACAQCSNDLVPSADGLSCVTCSSRYGSGSAFLSFGNCRCSASGFAGNDNTVCVDCLRVGKFVSGADGSTTCESCTGTQVLQSGTCTECPAGSCRVSEGFGGANNHVCEDCKRSGKEASTTGCTACTGTQVLQSGACAECPAGSVQSADKLSCVTQSTCSTQYGPGSQEVTPGTCRCSAAGFAGNDNTVCVDCLRIGKVVSGTAGSTTCEPCFGTQVLQAGVCSECPNNLVPSEDKASCISCAQRYGQGSIYSAIGICICDSTNGFAGTSNSVCSYCWVLGKTISGTTCASCSGTQVLQSGTCSECPSNLVPSLDKLICTTCSSIFGDGSTFFQLGTCRCSDSAGFAGSDNDLCTDCWRAGKKINGPPGSTVCDQFSSVCGQGEVQNPISKVCGCDGTKGYTGVSGSCYCNNQVGYAVSGTQCEQCWSLNKTALVGGCQACGEGEKFDDQLKSCVCNQTAGFVGQVGKCSCNSLLGHAPGSDPLQCEYCWANSQIALQASCQACGVGEIFETSSKTCICNKLLGFTGTSGSCSCNTLQGYASGPSQCVNCWANSQIALQSKCQSCGVGEKFEPTQNICICDQDSGFVGQVGKCTCNNLLGYSQILNSNPLQCKNCWLLNQTSSQSQCQSCGLHEVFDSTSKTCVCDSINGFVLTGGSCQCNTNLGLTLLQGQSTCSCNPLTGHVTLAGGSCGCDSASGLAGVTGACYCDFKKGFTGQPGKCYCNTALGFSPKMENGAIKSCECNANTGHLMLTDFVDGVSEKTCACNGQTGHAGEAGACYCDSATGNVGFPGSCFCNVNTFYIGKPGSCVNCGLKNAHPWQVGSDYVCQCNGVEGYGSPDASGVCKLCQSSNSVVKIDKDKQYQCVPCGPHQFVPDSNNTLCLCNASLFYVETPVNNSCVCQPQYILGSKGCEKSGNSSRVTIIAISVPLVILIILIILIIALIKKRKRRIKKHEVAEKQLKKMGPARLIVL
ncbi:Cysteine-rich_membrane protein 1 [Hexamita inflata]|uniref:Cysteine-rich membrane protein 1 n=1 Tax=Hexamita inflata TaxID=28002 RepID=A0AA86VF36_9EUKA|nr:Cysteine-rich membrane protein 1 [Hexamita inflata]